jgi:acetyltransferase
MTSSSSDLSHSRTGQADPAHDVFRGDRGSLDVFFRPKSVAVVGATEHAGTVGRTLLWNMISSSFGGTVYPVNPKRSSVLGIKAYPRVSDVPEAVDLAVIATPAPTVPDVIAECVSLGVPGAIVISAGFKEFGAEGAALEKRIQEIARGKMRILGPNCLGLMCPPSGFNATFAKGISAAGNVGFLSQSGALCTAVLDWSFRENIGFSAFASLGSMLDIGWGDLIDYSGQRSQNRKHRDLHGIRRRRPGVHVGGPRSVSDQTHHRHQGGSDRRRRQSRREPHGLPGGSRRRAGRRF